MCAANQCPLCHNNLIDSEATRSVQACGPCANRLGIVEMPPSRRPPTPCARCKHTAFIRVLPREHSVDRSGYGQVSAPMYVTYWPTRSNYTNQVTQVQIENSGVGLLEVFICKGCGFTEWYCIDFERIPIHPHLMTEEVDYTTRGDGPYR